MRTFRFVPFGANAPKDAVACDGLVPSAALDVSHWRGNKTPAELKADTSVEMALNFARADRTRADALVVNNHFDTDGVLAVFALLHPEIALEHRDVLIGAAEAGDFDEWPSDDRGLMLDAAIAKLAIGKSDEAAYASVLAALPALIPSLEKRLDLWADGLERLRMEKVKLSSRFQSESEVCFTFTAGIAVFHHKPGIEEKPGPVLSALSPRDAKRWLIALEREDGTFAYRYEMRRYAWADTIKRPTLTPPSRNAMAVALGEGFAIKGDLGMSGLLRTAHPIARAPLEIASVLSRSDTTL